MGTPYMIPAMQFLSAYPQRERLCIYMTGTRMCKKTKNMWYIHTMKYYIAVNNFDFSTN